MRAELAAPGTGIPKRSDIDVNADARILSPRLYRREFSSSERFFAAVRRGASATELDLLLHAVWRDARIRRDAEAVSAAARLIAHGRPYRSHAAAQLAELLRYARHVLEDLA